VFAVVITLVVFVSTALLIYQYWTGSLMPTDGEAPGSAPASPDSIDRVRTADSAALDTAA
jgi:hypothetical protein